MLKVEKCPSAQAVLASFKSLNIFLVPSLFVFVLEFEEEFAITTELSQFENIFVWYRPIILQFKTHHKNYFDVSTGDKLFVKSYRTIGFNYLSSIPSCQNLYTRAFIEMLQVYGFFYNDILDAEMSRIPENFHGSEHMAASVLCLRVANLFVGGVSRVMPWLKEDWILDLKHLPTLLAFIDYPFDHKKAAELAWKSEKF